MTYPLSPYDPNAVLYPSAVIPAQQGLIGDDLYRHEVEETERTAIIENALTRRERIKADLIRDVVQSQAVGQARIAKYNGKGAAAVERYKGIAAERVAREVTRQTALVQQNETRRIEVVQENETVRARLAGETQVAVVAEQECGETDRVRLVEEGSCIRTRMAETGLTDRTRLAEEASCIRTRVSEEHSTLRAAIGQYGTAVNKMVDIAAAVLLQNPEEREASFEFDSDNDISAAKPKGVRVSGFGNVWLGRRK